MLAPGMDVIGNCRACIEHEVAVLVKRMKLIWLVPFAYDAHRRVRERTRTRLDSYQ